MSEERELPPLFDFLAVLAVALLRKKITGPQAGIAILVALTSRGTTGVGATVDVDRLAVESDLSTRQVWRHFRAVQEAGWFVQTSKPTRGTRGEAGRRARYRVTSARLDLSHDLHVTRSRSEMSHEAAEATESCDSSGSNRVTVPAESCDTAGRELGTVTPSDGPTLDRYPSLVATQLNPAEGPGAVMSHRDDDVVDAEIVEPDDGPIDFAGLWRMKSAPDPYAHRFEARDWPFSDSCSICSQAPSHAYHQVAS